VAPSKHDDFADDSFGNESLASEDTGSEFGLDRGSYGAGQFDAPGPDLGAEEPMEDQAPDEEGAQETGVIKPAWYVVHCYSGYENKVKKNLEHRAESMGMLTHILEVIVPTEEQVELKEGQRRVVERRIYPGYVLVKMILDEESWYVVRNTPGVTGFVGIGNKPTPLRQEEVDRIMRRMEAEEPVAQVKVKVGDKVRIVEGNFLDFTGTVDEVYPDKGKARVLVSFFNRETPVEVDLLQIERL
jgi:transcription termination/antitermination protein NusG